MSNKIICLFVLLFTLTLCELHGLENKQNPLRAMLYSTLVPGGGQIYNHAYIKAAVVIGLQAYLVSSAINDNDKAQHYNALMDGTNNSIDQYYRQQRNNYRNDLKSDYWWIGTTMFLSVADAFVDAHLYNFKAEKEKVHLKFGDKKLQLEYRF